MTTRKKRKKLQALTIKEEWCKGCGICAAFCPAEVIALGDADKAAARNPEACTCCMLCALRCPDLAIEVLIEKDA